MCGLPGAGMPDVVHGLRSLVDKSMVTIEPETAGEVRYRLLASIREYGAEALEHSGEAARITDRFWSYAVSWAEQAEHNYRHRDHEDWFARTDAEYGTLKGALAGLRDAGRAGEALRLGAALGWYWFCRGRYREGLEWLEQVLALPPDRDRPGVRAKVLFYRWFLQSISGGPRQTADMALPSGPRLADLSALRHDDGSNASLVPLQGIERVVDR